MEKRAKRVKQDLRIGVCVTNPSFIQMNESLFLSHFVLISSSENVVSTRWQARPVDDQPLHTCLWVDNPFAAMLQWFTKMFMHGCSNGFDIIINLLWYSIQVVMVAVPFPSMKPRWHTIEFIKLMFKRKYATQCHSSRCLKCGST